MKALKELIFISALVVGLSLTASAQKDDQKKPPPKPSPPVINAPSKPPPDTKKPKPGFATIVIKAIEPYEAAA